MRYRMVWTRATATAVVLVLLCLTACGGSDTSDAAGTDGPSGGSSDAGDTSGADEAAGGGDGAESTVDGSFFGVVVEPSDPSDALPYVPGARIDVGTSALLGPVNITVTTISPGEPVDGDPTVNVQVIFANEHTGTIAGPDFSVVCADDGRFGLPTDVSTVQSLATLEAGQAVGGAVSIVVPTDCAEALVQIRVLPLEVGNDYIAEYALPDMPG